MTGEIELKNDGGRQISMRGVLAGMATGALVLGPAHHSRVLSYHRAGKQAKSPGQVSLGDFEAGLDGWTATKEAPTPYPCPGVHDTLQRQRWK